MVVKLAPLATITGRVVDADGNPIAGARVRPDVLRTEISALSFPQVVTGDDGRFRVPDVPAGCDYGLSFEAIARTNRRRYALPLQGGSQARRDNRRRRIQIQVGSGIRLTRYQHVPAARLTRLERRPELP